MSLFASLSISLLDLCSYLGLAAVAMVTLNLLLGILMSLRYSPSARWPHRRINLFALHQWTAYLAIAFTLTHPVVLLFLAKPHFGLYDILWPVASPLQPWINLTGAIALYLVVLVVGSSLLRRQIGRPLWRKLHYLVFPAAALLLVHSVFTDPDLKDGHPDLLDGGKVFLEGCVLLIAVLSTIRLRLRGRGLRQIQSGPSRTEAGGITLRPPV